MTFKLIKEVSTFEKFLEDFRSHRLFLRMGTVEGLGGRLFWFWRRRMRAWGDTPMQMVVRKKSQSSMVSAANNHGEFHIFIFVVSF